MELIEIIVIICACSIVLLVFGGRIYKRIKKMPIDECACCAKRMNKVVKKIKKEF